MITFDGGTKFAKGGQNPLANIVARHTIISLLRFVRVIRLSIRLISFRICRISISTLSKRFVSNRCIFT